MGYSNFKTLEQVVNKFGLEQIRSMLFQPSEIIEVEASNWLKESLERAELMPLTNEKARSERVISPILTEVFTAFTQDFSFFSGQNIDINAEDDLAGPCDFFFALHPPKDILEAPIVSLVEAKDEDMDYGMAQCAAQMYGAYLFNQKKGKPIETVYGCATTAGEWQFMKLENKVIYTHKKSYYLPQLNAILGFFHKILHSYQK